MTQVYNLLQNKRISIRVYKPLHKPIPNIHSSPSTSPSKKLNQVNLRRSYSPKKLINKEVPPKLKSQFNLCASKNVFVFARKQLPANPPLFMRTKQNYRREMTEEVFCVNPRTPHMNYRSLVRSSNGKREIMSSEQDRKRSSSQNFAKTVRIYPEPWQLKGQGHDFESLF